MPYFNKGNDWSGKFMAKSPFNKNPKEPKANMPEVTVTPEMEKKRKGSGKNLLTGGVTPTLVQLGALRGKNLRKIKGNIHKNK